ncbi:MAG: TetR/AcrR family transcriptional regulator [Segetibacter sp.]|nr:TetR/AcrR family transcriptional regulator [Segetibacter sp.]
MYCGKSFPSFALFIMEARERILAKADELFNRFGFRRVTMDEIALKTGMSKKTIYQSFENKDQIVNAVVEDHIKKSCGICEAHCANAENAVHEIFLNMETMQELVGEMNPTVFEDLEKFFPTVFVKLYQHKNEYLAKKVKDNLVAGIKEGFYRKELNIDIITKLRIENVFLPFRQEVFPFAKFSMVEVQKEILEHYLYGLCTPEGQELIKKYKNSRTKSN